MTQVRGGDFCQELNNQAGTIAPLHTMTATPQRQDDPGFPLTIKPLARLTVKSISNYKKLQAFAMHSCVCKQLITMCQTTGWENEFWHSRSQRGKQAAESQLHGSHFYSSFISSIFRHNFTINSSLSFAPDVSF